MSNLIANPTVSEAKEDAAWTPNPNGEWADSRGQAPCINTVAHDTEPYILRNVAIYYRQKGAEWAHNMAGMLERFAGADNDNVKGGRQHGTPRNRRAA